MPGETSCEGFSPVDEVHSPINGVDDPGGVVRQLHPLTCSHRFLPNEPEVTV